MALGKLWAYIGVILVCSSGDSSEKWSRKCGSYYPQPDGTPGQCDPDGEYPCCDDDKWGQCGNSVYDCTCRYCTDYKLLKDWNESNGTQKWRYDGMCGSKYPLPDGTPGQCDPDGDRPCCSDNVYGYCGNSTQHCTCEKCMDFKDWKESNGTKKWRYDGRCGSDYPLPDYTPSECDPDGDKPCCDGKKDGHCGNSAEHCSCRHCVDYKLLKEWKESGGKRKWRYDGKCGARDPLPDNTAGLCDPDGDKPCCSDYWNGECGNTTEHCTCQGCTDYRRIYKDWKESNGTQKWRYDRRCGRDYLLPDGTPSECNPDGNKPCCSIYKECGNTTEHCTCENCVDYRRIYYEWRESNGTQRWRYDGRCGSKHFLPDGSPAECDPDGDKPCCDQSNDKYARCSVNCSYLECIDYRVVKEIRKTGKDCSVVKSKNVFLQYLCFDNVKSRFYFKCPHSDGDYLVFNNLDGKTRSVSNVCENDKQAYQACGSSTQTTNSDVLCGGYFCENEMNGLHQYIECTGDYCKPENRDCKASYKKPTKCNDKCDDMDHCLDEYNCNGYHYGVECIWQYSDYYLHLDYVCDGREDCNDGSDEENCTVNNSTVYSCIRKNTYGRTWTVPIYNYTRCSVINFSDYYDRIFPYCWNYLDQTNCSDIERVGGYCEINGYMSTVSKYMVCYENDPETHLSIKLCDDDIEKNCLNLASNSDCRVHKHLLCDGVVDCSVSLDENGDICNLMTDTLNFFKCTRRFKPRIGETTIPIAWIMDNETDCVNGEDENPNMWRFCEGQYEYVTSLHDKGCQNVFKCPREDNSFVRFEQLCDGIESCGDHAEIAVCTIARDFPTIERTVDNDQIRNLCSLNGTSNCEGVNFVRPWGEVFGERKIELIVPTTKVDCTKLFGEFYLFLSCMDLCSEANTTCPLVGSNRKLNYNSCPLQYPDRAYTLGNNSFLTFVDESDNGQYHQDFYLCNNNKCIEYKQVCDLVDDCGDMSDEINCTNHMICEDTKNSRKHHFISLSQKCDGIYDCFDISDECNDTCGKKILNNWAIKLMCWLMGTLAMFFNLFATVRGFHSLKDCETEKMMTSKALMSLIGSGDFLIGTYLVILSVYDSIIFGEEFCQKQPEWLTGTPCVVLGVISTLGSQISLFTMTVLSIIRMYGLTCTPMRVPGPVTRKSIMKVTSLGMLTVMAALAIAIVPLISSLEDYFVQGMFYDDAYRVFIGFPNKERHTKILQAYYNENGTENGTNISSSMTWNEIGKKVDGMFSQDHGNLTRTPVHFYGNDGVCMFKYFVRTDDARRSRQSLETGTSQIGFNGDPVVWTMLAANLFCFIVITCCYIVITCKTRQSSQRSGQQNNQDRQREERAIQNKIMLIIATDFFCWVPFIIISALHNLEYIDASKWYASFAMTVLPLNSVVNPLVYDKALVEMISQQVGKLSAVVKLGTSSFNTNILVRLRGVTSNKIVSDNTNDINLTNLDEARCAVGTAHDGVTMNANDGHDVNDNDNIGKNHEFYECDNFNEIEI